MEEAKSELSRIIQDREMRNVVLLVFANKQDVDGGKFQSLVTESRIAGANDKFFQPCDPTM
jgi:ADP-ribosylation factor protein 6